MPASRCGFKTKLLCSTPRRKRLRPMGSMTGSTFATKDYGAVNLHRSAFISAIPRRSTDHPDSGYGSATEGCVDSLNGAASLEWPTPRTPGTPRSRAYALCASSQSCPALKSTTSSGSRQSRSAITLVAMFDLFRLVTREILALGLDRIDR